MRVLGVKLAGFFTIGLALWGALPAQALSTVPFEPSPAQAASPVIVTGYGFDGIDPTHVQLFNKSDEIANLSGWRLEFRRNTQTDFSLLVELDGLLRPGNYVLAAEAGLIRGADYEFDILAAVPVVAAVSLRLMPAGQYKSEEVKLPTKLEVSHYRRNISESTGAYLSTFASFVPAPDHQLYGGGLYEAPSAPLLLFSEIFANPRECSPIDETLTCREYVKLYNQSTSLIDLSTFRLRVGVQGQEPTASNTFPLTGMIESSGYLTIFKGADGEDINLTNSGAYVWLEDMYGVRLYESTVQDYPDASSTTHKGQAWAYDRVADAWKWTSLPTPAHVESLFPVIKEAPISEESLGGSLLPCAPNQYRNPETNRCRLLLATSEAAALTTCPAGQYRNPITNRCRQTETVSSLAPCAPGEERNPATNRCRQVVSTLAALTPCKPNQERNPETNRCRNKGDVSGSSLSSFPVEPIAQSGTDFVGWWVFGGIAAAGLAYGVWEWHHELRSAGLRLLRRIPFVK